MNHFHGSMKIKGNKWISVEIHNLEHSNVIVTVKNLIVFILLRFKRNWDIYFPFPRELFTLFYFGLQSHQKKGNALHNWGWLGKIVPPPVLLLSPSSPFIYNLIIALNISIIRVAFSVL